MSALPDVLDDNLKVVFCGMAAGKKSAREGAYYAGPGNRFWQTLHEVGLTPQRLEPCQFPDLVLYGIGLTDLEKQQAGNDNELDLSNIDRDGLRARIEDAAPRVLAFVGKRAAQEFFNRQQVEYGRQPELLGSTAIFVLPSPSGAARGYWDVSYWRDLAQFLVSD